MSRNACASTNRRAGLRHRIVVAMSPMFVAMLLAACGKEPAAVERVEAVPANAPARPAAVPVPASEPPADVVRALIYEQYAEIEKAGGMPMTVTATGQGLQVRAKLFDARKDECHPVPQQPAGSFECTLTINVAMTGDGSDPAFEEPSEQGARIGVKWDPSGKWVRE